MVPVRIGCHEKWQFLMVTQRGAKMDPGRKLGRRGLKAPIQARVVTFWEGGHPATCWDTILSELNKPQVRIHQMSRVSFLGEKTRIQFTMPGGSSPRVARLGAGAAV